MMTSDLSVENVAMELGTHQETIRRLLTAGEMPGYKAGRHWRVTRAALDQFKASGGVRRPGRQGQTTGQKQTVDKAGGLYG